jgi:hypothetical protein
MAIHRSVVLETYDELRSLDPPLHCAPLIHRVARLRVAPPG